MVEPKAIFCGTNLFFAVAVKVKNAAAQARNRANKLFYSPEFSSFHHGIGCLSSIKSESQDAFLLPDIAGSICSGKLGSFLVQVNRNNYQIESAATFLPNKRLELLIRL